jgi:hypothetical protein
VSARFVGGVALIDQSQFLRGLRVLTSAFVSASSFTIRASFFARALIFDTTLFNAADLRVLSNNFTVEPESGETVLYGIRFIGSATTGGSAHYIGNYIRAVFPVYVAGQIAYGIYGCDVCGHSGSDLILDNDVLALNGPGFYGNAYWFVAPFIGGAKVEVRSWTTTVGIVYFDLRELGAPFIGRDGASPFLRLIVDGPVGAKFHLINLHITSAGSYLRELNASASARSC